MLLFFGLVLLRAAWLMQCRAVCSRRVVARHGVLYLQCSAGCGCCWCSPLL